MKDKLQTIAFISAAVFVSCLFASTASAQSQNALARAVVFKLYKAKPSPFFQTKKRVLLDAYFTKELANMIWKDAVTSKGEVGAINGDPLYNAQDKKIKDLVIGDAMVKDVAGPVRSYFVRVTFTNFGKKQAINYSLKKTTKGWRIDDIIYDKDNSLRKWLKA